MKAFSFREKDFGNFTADLYSYTTTTDASGGEIFTFNFNRTVPLIIVTGYFGRMTCYFRDSESDVRIQWRLYNVKDKTGQEMNPNFIYTLDQLEPNINVFGDREGYKARMTFFGANNA
jgi:hypothetical protein